MKYENPVSSPDSNCAVLLPQEEAAVRDLAGFPKLSGWVTRNRERHCTGASYDFFSLLLGIKSHREDVFRGANHLNCKLKAECINCILRTNQTVPHQSKTFWAHLQNIFLHSTNILFVHCETCSTKYKGTSGNEVQELSLETSSAFNSYIQVFSYFKKPYYNFFCQLQLHLHMGLTILLSLDLYVYFFATKLAPLLEKKNEMVIWDSSWTPDWFFFSMIQAQPHGSPQKKRAAFLFHSSCTLGHCYFLCVFLHVLSWYLTDFF